MIRFPLRAAGPQSHWELAGDSGEDTSELTHPRAKETHGIFLPLLIVIYGWMTAPRGKSPQSEPVLCTAWASTCDWRLPSGGETQKLVVSCPWLLNGTLTASLMALLFPKISTWSALNEKFKQVRALDQKCEIQVPITALKKGNQSFPDIPQNCCPYNLQNPYKEVPSPFFQPRLLYASSVQTGKPHWFWLAFVNLLMAWGASFTHAFYNWKSGPRRGALAIILISSKLKTVISFFPQ